MRRKILVIDTETGGLDANKNALISIAAVVVIDGCIADKIEVIVADPEGEYDAGALKVNGFTKEWVQDNGVTPLVAVQTLKNFYMKNNMPKRITLAGHNVAFDIAFLERLYRMAGESYRDQYYHGGLCTRSAFLLLEQAGRLPYGEQNLDAVCKALSVPLERAKKHVALDDAVACALALRKMTDLLSK